MLPLPRSWLTPALFRAQVHAWTLSHLPNENHLLFQLQGSGKEPGELKGHVVSLSQGPGLSVSDELFAQKPSVKFLACEERCGASLLCLREGYFRAHHAAASVGTGAGKAHG